MSRFCRCFIGLWLAAVAVAACSQGAATDGGGGRPGVSLALGGAADGNCIASGVGGSAAGDGGAYLGCSPEVSVDYARDVAPILARCAGEVCHSFDTTNVRAWIGAPADECCNRRELIAAGRPERSYLIDKLEGQRLCSGARMPLGRPPLATADIAILKGWICAGAMLP